MIKGKVPLTLKQSSRMAPKKIVNIPAKATEREKMLKPTVKENEKKETVMNEKPNLQSKILRKPLQSYSKDNFKPLASNKPQEELFPCKQCGRSFVHQSLKRHEKICKKIFIKKRNPFNSAKQRIVTKEQLVIYKKSQNKSHEQSKKSKVIPNKMGMPEWKMQSMALRVAMKKMRGAKISEEEVKEVKKIEKIEQKNMFKCKFCGKKFNEEAGKRHQAFCQTKSKDMKNRMKAK